MSFVLRPQSFFSIGPNRSFAGISGYVVINENTTDSMEITRHPIQQGAPISDHAYRNPVTLSIQINFSSSLSFSTLTTGLQSLKQIYDTLLALQNPIPPNVLTPFDCVTPKRTYNNMLLKTISQVTDKKTENVLAINATFEQVIIVPVSTVNVPRSQLRNPGNNGGVQKAGKNSALLNLTQGLFPSVKGVSQ